MFDTILLGNMPHVAQVLPLAGVDVYGARSYGAAIPATGYWVARNVSMESSTGQTRSTSGDFYAAPPAYWTPSSSHLPTTDDALVLPDGSQVTIDSVEVYRDDDEVYGVVIHYG